MPKKHQSEEVDLPPYTHDLGDDEEIVDMGRTGLSDFGPTSLYLEQDDWTGETVMVHPRDQKHATVLSSTINLLNTIVGSGVLSMPFALVHMGVAFGAILVFVMGAVTYFSMYLMSAVGEKLLRDSAFMSIDLSATPSLGRLSIDTTSALGPRLSADTSRTDGALPPPPGQTDSAPPTPTTPVMPAPSPAYTEDARAAAAAAKSTSPAPGGAVAMRPEERALPRVTYPWVMRNVAPRSSWLLHLGIFLLCYGICIAYLLVVSETALIVVDTLAGPAGYGSSESATSSMLAAVKALPVLRSRYFWVGVVFVLVAPFTYFKRLNALRYLGYLNMFCVAYLFIMMTYYFAAHIGDIKAAPALKMGPSDVSAVSNLSIIVFAYACQPNFYAVFDEIGEPNRKKRATRSSLFASTAAAFIYALFGIFGAYGAGVNCKANIMASLPSGSWYVTVGRFAIMLNVSCGFPLLFHPFRVCVESMFDNAKCCSKFSARQRRYLVTTVLLLLVVAVAMAFKELDLVLSLTGCTGGAIVSFILPGYIYWKAFPDKKTPMNICAMILLVFGAVFMVAGVVITLVFAFTKDPVDTASSLASVSSTV